MAFYSINNLIVIIFFFLLLKYPYVAPHSFSSITQSNFPLVRENLYRLNIDRVFPLRRTIAFYYQMQSAYDFSLLERGSRESYGVWSHVFPQGLNGFEPSATPRYSQSSHVLATNCELGSNARKAGQLRAESLALNIE